MLSTFIKLPFIIKVVVLSIFEGPLKTGFIVDILFKFATKCRRLFCHLLVILKRLCIKQNCIGAKYLNLRSSFISYSICLQCCHIRHIA